MGATDELNELTTRAKQQRLRLLEQRRALRARLTDQSSATENDAVQAELKELSVVLKTVREKVEKARRKHIVKIIWEAYQQRNFAEMHRLRIQY
eukprot:1906059-Pyramimonas_sp.AAC.1